jgi:hypothetical protein
MPNLDKNDFVRVIKPLYLKLLSGKPYTKSELKQKLKEAIDSLNVGTLENSSQDFLKWVRKFQRALDSPTNAFFDLAQDLSKIDLIALHTARRLTDNEFYVLKILQDTCNCTAARQVFCTAQEYLADINSGDPKLFTSSAAYQGRIWHLLKDYIEQENPSPQVQELLKRFRKDMQNQGIGYEQAYNTFNQGLAGIRLQENETLFLTAIRTLHDAAAEQQLIPKTMPQSRVLLRELRDQITALEAAEEQVISPAELRQKIIGIVNAYCQQSDELVISIPGACRQCSLQFYARQLKRDLENTSISIGETLVGFLREKKKQGPLMGLDSSFIEDLDVLLRNLPISAYIKSEHDQARDYSALLLVAEQDFIEKYKVPRLEENQCSAEGIRNYMVGLFNDQVQLLKLRLHTVPPAQQNTIYDEMVKYQKVIHVIEREEMACSDFVEILSDVMELPQAISVDEVFLNAQRALAHLHLLQRPDNVSDEQLETFKEDNKAKVKLVRCMRFFASQTPLTLASNATKYMYHYQTFVDLMVKNKIYKRGIKEEDLDLSLIHMHLKMPPGMTPEEIDDETRLEQYTKQIPTLMQEKLLPEITQRCDALANGETKRFQVILDIGSHHVPIDFQISRDQDGNLQKQCFVLDAGQEYRSTIATETLHQWMDKVYVAGTAGQKLQFDGTSCPVFAMHLLARASKDEGLFQRLAQLPAGQIEKEVSGDKVQFNVNWMALGPEYYKLAQSVKFVNFALSQQAKAGMETQAANSKGDTAHSFWERQRRTLTMPDSSLLGNLMNRMVTKEQNAASDNKGASYVHDCFVLTQVLSASELRSLVRDPKAAAAAHALPLAPTVSASDIVYDDRVRVTPEMVRELRQ